MKTIYSFGLLSETFVENYEIGIWKGVTQYIKEKEFILKCFIGGALDAPLFHSRKNFIYNLVDRKNVDGLIVITSSIGKYTSLERISEFLLEIPSIPIITIGTTLPGIPSVQVDNEGGMRALLEHFIEKHNKKQIAFIKGNENTQDAKIRYQVYKQILNEYDIPYREDLVAPGDFTWSAGPRAVNYLIDEKRARFDALIASNDYMALFAIKELNKKGINVPGDIIVGGFDNILDTHYATPSLTTVTQSSFAMGYRGASLLDSILSGGYVQEKNIVPSELFIRESCGCKEHTFSHIKVNSREEKIEASAELYKAKINSFKKKLRQMEERSLIQNEFNDMINSMTTHEELNTELPKLCKKLGIHSFFISFYITRGTKEVLIPFFAFKDNKIIDLKYLPEEYPAQQIVPVKWNINLLYETLYINSIFSENFQKGVVVLETGYPDVKFNEKVSEQINNVLNRIELFSSLQQYTTTLEKKVKERTNQLEEANRQKTTFFINLAHETKTPLTLIKNYLKKYIDDTGMSRDLEVIKRNIDMLLRNMVNFLDIEKLNKSQIYYDHSHVLNIAEILKNKIPLFREIAKSKKIKIESKLVQEGFIKIDPFAIDRIINNLLDNAIKYTPNGGNVSVSLVKKEEKVILMVTNSGMCISDEQIDNIFKPYYQLSHEKRNIQGIGMGLHIVKSIIDAIGADIKIRSKIGKGTEFKIIFKQCPWEEAKCSRAEYSYSIPMETGPVVLSIKELEIVNGKNNILLIDDNLEMLNFFQSFLKKKYNLFLATNGIDALRKINIIPIPDVIISDIMMDKMDGHQLYSELQKIEEYQAIPFIFLTARNRPKDKIKGLSQGALDYIYKPFNIEEVMAKIDSIINNKKKQVKQSIRQIKRKVMASLSEEESHFEFFYKLDKIYEEHGITSREKEILEWLIQGLVTKEISKKLNISVRTVEFHIYNLYKKFDVQNKIELLNYFKKL